MLLIDFFYWRTTHFWINGFFHCERWSFSFIIIHELFRAFDIKNYDELTIEVETIQFKTRFIVQTHMTDNPQSNSTFILSFWNYNCIASELE